METLMYILIAIQALLGVALITLIMIHSPKGDGVAGIGASAQMFSAPQGAEEGLNKITMYVVFAFFAVSFVTGYYGHSMMGL